MNIRTLILNTAGALTLAGNPTPRWADDYTCADDEYAAANFYGDGQWDDLVCEPRPEVCVDTIESCLEAVCEDLSSVAAENTCSDAGVSMIIIDCDVPLDAFGF